MKDLIALCGYAGHGKDTVVDFLVRDCGRSRVAFADAIREQAIALNPIIRSGRIFSNSVVEQLRLSDILSQCNYDWDKAKKESEVRRLLQRLGTEAGRDIFGENVWIDIAMRKCAGFEYPTISDLRFENEEKAVKALGGIIWRVERTGYDNGVGTSHASEAYLASIKHGELILNDGTLEDLRIKVFKLAVKYNYISEGK
jgi:hypothetical protein